MIEICRTPGCGRPARRFGKEYCCGPCKWMSGHAHSHECKEVVMKTKVVQPGDLSPHSLRAEDYMRSQGGPITREDVMKKVIEAGRTLYQQDGFIEIDDNALPSLGEPPIDGFYLQAWVWINLSDLDLDDPGEVEKLFSIYRKKRKP